MGILNVTPDSFSDGGRFLAPERAAERAFQMIDEGADFIDVGGESTRPQSEPISADEELRRVLPVIARLAEQTDIPISIDTTKAKVASETLAAGARIVNDISGLHFDAKMAAAVADKSASVVLMHIKGTPQTMQLNPTYDNLVGEVIAYLQAGIEKAKQAGIVQIIVDPGIGFGKTQAHNLQLLRELTRLKALGFPILVGASRKNFIGNILKLPVEQRVEGSVAAAIVAAMNGANIVRVHDVKETKRAMLIADAIRNSCTT
jgi:dihydropteroate synthase